MGRQRAHTLRTRRVDLRTVDAVVAAGLCICAIVDARVQLAGSFGFAAVVCCAVCGGTAAWRRVHPAWACFTACTAYAVLIATTGYAGGGMFEWVAVALTFYMLGRLAARDLSWVAAGLLVYWVTVASVAYGVAQAGPPAAVVGLVSYAVGRWFAVRSTVITELAAQTAALEREQALRARDAVEEERRAIARELHDVVAHSVSVMVVQTVGARSVAATDPVAARRALAAVEIAGREALVELRRIVGVLRHDGSPLSDAAAPAVANLPLLVERARAVGVPVEFQVDGRPRELPAGLELVVYRLIQEGLTNVIKHSGQAAARVQLSYEDQGVRVEVSDSGTRTPSGQNTSGAGPGHGLRGMRERVALYGGQVDFGPLPTGGFAVRARIPYEGDSPAVRLGAGPNPHADASRPVDRLRWRWLDPVLAVLVLILLEQRVLTAGHVRGPLAVSVVLAGGVAVAAASRRRHPITFSAVVALVALSLVELGPLKHTLVSLCLLAWALYTVATWADRRTAVAALGVIVALLSIGQVLGNNDANLGQFVGMVFLLCVPWCCGFAMQSRRRMTDRLASIASQLAEEREDRARLAVVSERSKIAHELHAAVARSVAAMVVQAEAATTALDQDARAADALLEATELTGRTALADMRRILGVLRRPGEIPGREPQPGIGQIHGLIRRARAAGQAVQMTIDGEPGTLPRGVEVGVYRILAEALSTARARPERPVDVSLKFGTDELELSVHADANEWPTNAMRESASMCDGELRAHRDDDGRCGLVARMPTALQGALA